ncbi:MAG: DUF3617 domain-containing protein [Pseudomonadota bacterium]
MLKPMIAVTLCAFAGATAAVAIEPGRWESISKVVDFEMALPPGMPEGMMDMMKSQMVGKPQRDTQCITRADLDEAPERMFAETDGQCRYDRFDMSGGRMTGVATCQMQGATMRMTTTGTHDANSYKGVGVMEGDGEMGAMTIRTEFTGTRLGDC